MKDNISRHSQRFRSGAIPDYVTGTWKSDPAHSTIDFSIGQLVCTTVRGRFTGCDVTLVTAEDPLDSSVVATIDLATLDTGNEKRNEHVRSATFLDVETYPTAIYRSTGVRRTSRDWAVDGELTLHGITRPVCLIVAPTGFGPDPSGGNRAGFTATTQIRRSEFGIDKWLGGGLVVSDKVPITIRLEAVSQL